MALGAQVCKEMTAKEIVSSIIEAANRKQRNLAKQEEEEEREIIQQQHHINQQQQQVWIQDMAKGINSHDKIPE